MGIEESDRKLRLLGEHAKKGWAKLHPISEKHLEAVRNTVREEWKREHGEEREKKSTGENKSHQEKEHSDKKSQDRSKSDSKGTSKEESKRSRSDSHDHGH